MKHDARNSYSANNVDPTVNDIAISLKSFNFDGDDENMTQTQTGTYRTFATNYSSCTNMSFSKLLNGFRSDSQLHKEMLAILAALTDVIKERGGTQTSTEYFLALMETIEAANEETEIIASISLLNMGIRTVSEAVLRMKFSETAGLLMMHMQKFVDTDNQNILKNVMIPIFNQIQSNRLYNNIFFFLIEILRLLVHCRCCCVLKNTLFGVCHRLVIFSMQFLHLQFIVDQKFEKLHNMQLHQLYMVHVLCPHHYQKNR